MFDSFTSPAGVIQDAIRTLFSWLDRVAFGVLEVFYQLFFNVASADLFSNDTIMRFYGRVQLIIGVYMMFLFAMTIIKGIVNPDTFTGGKDGGGASKLITRIITALILLTVLVPINIGSPRNEYEEQIKSNGLLFGTLYSLQHRILANNTLGRLILGNDSSSSSYFSSEGEDNLKQSSRIFTSTILKGFYRINLLDEDERPKHEDGKDDAIFNENRVCQDIDDDVLAAYTRLDAKPGDILGMVNMTCEVDDGGMNILQRAISLFSPKLAGKQRYVFTFMPLISTVTGIIFAIILLSFSVDIAVRAVKLAVLRLIAPIPIISYMDPKGAKDNAFNSWVKTLTSTYLDLFIRLAVVYFVIFLIQDMIINGVVINHGDGLIGILSLIIIWIGLFAFAKQAPKFIREVLGMKGDGGKLFSGFGYVGAAAGLGAAIGGSIGTARAGAIASRRSDLTRQSNGEDVDPNSFLNRGKHLIAGIAGGVSGLATGISASNGAKDHEFRAVRDAQQKQITTAMSNGGNGSTLFGRVGANFARTFQGDTAFDATTREIAQNKEIEKTGKDLFSYLEGKGKTDGAGIATSAAYNGHTVHTSLDSFKRAWAQASSELQRGVGDGSFTIDGQSFNINDGATSKFQDDLTAAAGTAWAAANAGDAGLTQKIDSYNEAVGINNKNGYVHYTDMATLKKNFKAAGGKALRDESDASYRRRQADYGATKK